MPQSRGWGGYGRSLWGLAARIVSMVGVLLLAAGPVGAQTLTEALAYAYNNNPQLLAQRALLRSTDEQVPQALGNWRPVVNFTGSAGYNRSGFRSSEAPGAATACATSDNPAYLTSG